MKTGFVGLGQMGAPMAANLAAENDVTVFDRNADKRALLDGKCTAAVEALAGLAACELIFLCLPNGKVVTEVLFGEGGLAPHLKPSTVIVDTSTIEYAATLEIAEKLDALGVPFVDAPVSGMQARAEEGSLTMMCGGAEDAVDRLRPQLAAMASNVLYMGPTGSGQLMKLINQLLFDINAAAIAEILPLAVKLGLAPEKVGTVVNGGTGRSFASEFFIPHILNGDFSNGYPMAAAYKDLISGAEISARHQIPAPVLAAATATYQQALRAGHGDKDKGGMIRVFEDALGVSFRASKNGDGQ